MPFLINLTVLLNNVKALFVRSEFTSIIKGGKDILIQILNITQGNHTAAEYAIEFRTLVAQSGWNDISLKAVFQRGLNTELQTELACKGENSSFSEFVTLAIKTT